LKNIPWEDIRPLCTEIAAKLKLPKKTGNRSVLLKAAYLSHAHSQLDEPWIREAAEIVSNTKQFKTSAGAMFHSLLKASCDRRGLNFNRLLTLVTVPDHVLNPPIDANGGASQ